MEPDALERQQLANHPSGEVQMFNNFVVPAAIGGGRQFHSITIYIRQQADFHPKRFLFIRVQSHTAHPVNLATLINVPHVVFSWLIIPQFPANCLG